MTGGAYLREVWLHVRTCHALLLLVPIGAESGSPKPVKTNIRKSVSWGDGEKEKQDAGQGLEKVQQIAAREEKSCCTVRLQPS